MDVLPGHARRRCGFRFLLKGVAAVGYCRFIASQKQPLLFMLGNAMDRGFPLWRTVIESMPQGIKRRVLFVDKLSGMAGLVDQRGEGVLLVDVARKPVGIGLHRHERASDKGNGPQ